MLDLNGTASNPDLINSFIEITSSTKDEAVFFLESHQWDLDAAVSAFLDSSNYPNNSHARNNVAAASGAQPALGRSTDSNSQSSDYTPSPSQSQSRSRSPSSVEPEPRVRYSLRSRGKKPVKGRQGRRVTPGKFHPLTDLNQLPSEESDAKDGEEEDDVSSEQCHQGRKKRLRVAEKTAEHRQPSSSIRNIAAETSVTDDADSCSPEPVEIVNHAVTLWRNGFTVDSGPFRKFNDPANASFLESIRKSECPKELEPVDGKTKVHLDLKKREETYAEPQTLRKRKGLFPGVGRTLSEGSDSDVTALAATDAVAVNGSSTPVQGPSTGLVVDSSLPTTSIQLRLADGTRMVSRFNLHHTIRDLFAFIEASRVGGRSNYQLQAMGFPPKQLTDQDQTIEDAGIANSVVIQKF